MSLSISHSIDPLIAAVKSNHKNKSLEHAFLLWYVEMRFGKSVLSNGQGHFVDGSGDLGVDYVVETKTGWVVIQSKFSQTQLHQPVAANALQEFERVTYHLGGHSDDQSYKQWSAGAAGGLVNLYSKVRSASKGKRQVRFVLVTTKSMPISDYSFQIESGAEIAYLFSLYEEGFTAQYPDLELAIEDTAVSAVGSGRLLVGKCDIGELLGKMQEFHDNGVAPDRLFEQNVRGYLGPSGATKGIVSTYQKTPDKFFAKHNGIYFTCYKVKKVVGNRWVMRFPSVVNGAQTLWSLYNHVNGANPHSAKVLVRVLESESGKLRDEVIGATNTQRAMAPSALLAHHETLPRLAKTLDAGRIFLERQQRSWVNEARQKLTDHRPLSIKELIQFVHAAESSKYLGSLRAKVSTYLEQGSADPLLNSLADEKDPSAKNRLVVAAAAGLLGKKLPQRIAETSKGGASSPIGKRRKQQARIASLLMVHVIAQSLGGSETTRDRLIHALSNGLERRITKDLALFMLKLLDRAVVAQKEASSDFSNFFKSDSLINDFIESNFGVGDRKRLSTILSVWSKQE